MAATYDYLASSGISGSTFSFTGFSSSYDALMLQIDFTSSNSNVDVYMNFNDSTAASYYALQGGVITGPLQYKTTYWNAQGNLRLVGIANSAGTTPTSLELYIPRYATSVVKNGFYTISYGILPNDNIGNVQFGAWQWRESNAITKITLVPTSGTLTGRASIYGITGANA